MFGSANFVNMLTLISCQFRAEFVSAKPCSSFYSLCNIKRLIYSSIKENKSGWEQNFISFLLISYYIYFYIFNTYLPTFLQKEPFIYVPNIQLYYDIPKFPTSGKAYVCLIRALRHILSHNNKFVTPIHN